MSPQPLSDADRLHHNQASLTELQTGLRREAGEFSLTLALCNYHRLRNTVIEQFVSTGQAAAVRLPRKIPSLLGAIQTQLKGNVPPALMVVGLELMDNLPGILKGANLSRDELRKVLPCPWVIWGNETVHQAIARHAPDLRSFSPAAIAFTLPASDLSHALQQGTDQLFLNILEYEGDRDLASTTTIHLQGSPLLRSELEFATADLAAQGWQPDPDLRASLDFLQGRDAHSRLEMEAARSRYEASLAHWQQAQNQEQEQHQNPTPEQAPTWRDREAVLLLHLGLWWRSFAVLQRTAYHQALRQARQYFSNCLKIFRQEDQLERLARFIHVLAEVLQKQRDWAALERLAVEGIIIHRQTADAIRLARDHGFLAEIALIKADWLTAHNEAVLALALLEVVELAAAEAPEDLDLVSALAIARQFQRGWYRFLLGESQIRLTDPETAIPYLEAARWETDPEVDLTLHRQVLEKLIHHYFQQGQYWNAFDVKQELRRVEYRYNLRAFIGAGTVQPHQRTTVATPLDDNTYTTVASEIQASGRVQDVEALVARLESDRHQVIVIHGGSGVGKSSILNAGLIPALRTLYPRGRTTVPILVQTYGNWQQGIAKELDKALATWVTPPVTPSAVPPTPAELQGQIQTGLAKNRFFVLVFDQFEEFFFEENTLAERRQFYTFLHYCIDQPWVKVVLALREDYLHHLLEVERIVNQISTMGDLDLLSRQVRYPLGNFSPAAAEAVIRRLTAAAQAPLEEALVHRLVNDLAAQTGDVRPIELQVVGAQLQREEIDTLATYQNLGDSPKETLVQRFLAYVVQDCGPPNERLAWVVLYLLTDEDREHRLYRPFRTREDLEYELSLLKMPFEGSQLDLVLSILVGSGLVFEVPEEPEDRYQLVHDYLVSYVRQEQTPELMAELTAARHHPTQNQDGTE